MGLILNKEISSTLENVSELVVLVSESLRAMSVLSVVIDDIEIAIAEAMTNIVKHAYKYDETKKIEFSLSKLSEFIVIEIFDSAPEIKLDFNKELVYDHENIDTLPEGGMGIFLMNKCMNSIELKRANNKNQLIMKKKYE